jgi:hypothetical protein
MSGGPELGTMREVKMRNGFALTMGAMAFAVALTGSAAAPQAGERGCIGKCYEEVLAPPIHTTWLRRETLRTGLYEIDREPSLYGLATRRVLVDDGVDWHEEPSVYRTVKVRRHIRSSVRWEKQWRDGRYIMCKVKVPGRTVWVDKQVLVKRGKRWKVRGTPVYRYHTKRVLLRPYKNILVHHRPVHRYVREKVVIQPESTVWVPVRHYD